LHSATSRTTCLLATATFIEKTNNFAAVLQVLLELMRQKQQVPTTLRTLSLATGPRVNATGPKPSLESSHTQPSGGNTKGPASPGDSTCKTLVPARQQQHAAQSHHLLSTPPLVLPTGSVSLPVQVQHSAQVENMYSHICSIKRNFSPSSTIPWFATSA